MLQSALIAIALGLLLCCAQLRASDDAVVIARSGSAPTIVNQSQGKVAATAVQRLARYLQMLTGVPPALRDAGNDADDLIIVGDALLARQYAVPAPDPSRDESFSIAPIPRDGKLRLIICGQSDVGIKQGIYYVLRNLRAEGGAIALTNPTVQSSPFIRWRVSHVGGYTRQSFDRQTGKRLAQTMPASDEQLAWNHLTHWSPQRVGDYVDLLDFLGYNGIEEPPTLYARADQDETSISRRKTLRQHVEQNGMIAIAKIDGTLFSDHAAVPYGADSKAQYDRYYREIAQAAAPYNDFVLTHWVDAGGWKGDAAHPCTIELLQDLHMQITREFARFNPHIESVLSLWNLDNPQYQRWLGYRGVEAILGSGKIAPSVMIAMSRKYRPDDAHKITAAGNKAAVWGWYLADHELLYTMHVHTHVLADYLQQLPAGAREALFLHTLDNCQRETNIYSIYVGARMLWDPRGDPETYLREIARLVYGPKLQDQVFHGLKAIADVRCGKKCSGCWTAGADASNGVVTFEQGVRQSAQAWEELKAAEIDKTYVPPVRLPQTPGVLLNDLKGHVHAVAAYMEFLRDKKDRKTELTEVPKAEGPFEYYERLRYLQNAVR